MFNRSSNNNNELRALQDAIRQIDQAAGRLQGILNEINKKSIKNQAVSNRILLSQVQLSRIADTLSKRWVREELR